MSVAEIKQAIAKLSPQEYCELMAELHPYPDDEWDQQMKADAEKGGKLDRLREVAHQEYKRGESKPFPKPAE
jgi:hypothetical protein